MPILDQFCLWESPMKFVFQRSKISISTVTDLKNAVHIEHIEICCQSEAWVRRASQILNPIKKPILSATSQPDGPSSLNQCVYVEFYIQEKYWTSRGHFQKKKVMSASQARLITRWFQEITKKEDMQFESLKLQHQHTPAACFSNNQHTGMIFTVPTRSQALNSHLCVTWVITGELSAEECFLWLQTNFAFSHHMDSFPCCTAHHKMSVNVQSFKM